MIRYDRTPCISFIASVRSPAPQERHKHEKPQEIGTECDALIEANEGCWLPCTDLRRVRQGQTEERHHRCEADEGVEPEPAVNATALKAIDPSIVEMPMTEMRCAARLASPKSIHSGAVAPART